MAIATKQELENIINALYSIKDTQRDLSKNLWDSNYAGLICNASNEEVDKLIQYVYHLMVDKRTNSRERTIQDYH
tara:strand:- start:224 stop:448 length:225 start_codon:yes stop_codon:yes gene_type:complete